MWDGGRGREVLKLQGAYESLGTHGALALSQPFGREVGLGFRV